LDGHSGSAKYGSSAENVRVFDDDSHEMIVSRAVVAGAGGQIPSPLQRQEKRDFSLRRPTLSQERKRKKKSACSVRNDGVARRRGEEQVGLLRSK
jgi:hypothetical protein